jgi:AraC-like DNA-binding protein/ligand-binding sensor protein
MEKLGAIILPTKFENVRVQTDRFGIRDESTVTRVKQTNGQRSTISPQAVAMKNNLPLDFVKQLSRSRFYQDYEQAFGKTTKLPLELSSIDMGPEVHRFRSEYASPFCAILARTSKICDACLKVQRKLTSANISDTQTMRCFAGLTVTSVPVKLEERVIAFLQTGQVFLRTPSAKRFQKIASQLIRWGVKVNLLRLQVAYFRSRVVSPSLYQATVRLLEFFAEHLALIANQVVLQQRNRDSPMIERAKDYVAIHQSDPIKLEQVARALNVSTFYFCRRFKQTTGLTFVEYLNRVRIEKAKVLLHNNNLRVSEIAYEAGFQTIAHFNRIFRKLVGHSPTEFRSTLAEIR